MHSIARLKLPARTSTMHSQFNGYHVLIKRIITSILLRYPSKYEHALTTSKYEQHKLSLSQKNPVDNQYHLLQFEHCWILQSEKNKQPQITTAPIISHKQNVDEQIITEQYTLLADVIELSSVKKNDVQFSNY